jgi:hypothetical protein
VDCLALLRGSRTEFLGFLAMMNAVDQDIKFTAEIDWEQNRVVFLDLVITTDKDRFLQTDLFLKSNAKNSLLLPSSCHPPSVTRASVYGLALRVNRNCSTPEAADLRYEEVAARLRQREYAETVIEAGISKAKAVPRDEALRKVVRQQGGGGRRHRLVTEFDRRSSPALVGILKANYEQMKDRDQRMGRIFPNPPRPSFKRSKNIKDHQGQAAVGQEGEHQGGGAAGEGRANQMQQGPEPDRLCGLLLHYLQTRRGHQEDPSAQRQGDRGGRSAKLQDQGLPLPDLEQEGAGEGLHRKLLQGAEGAASGAQERHRGREAGRSGRPLLRDAEPGEQPRVPAVQEGEVQLPVGAAALRDQGDQQPEPGGRGDQQDTKLKTNL